MAQQSPSPLLPTLGFALIVVVVVAAAFVFHPNSYSAANQQVTYQRLYGAPVAGGNYSFSPPITKYHAINTALANDNLTTSDLQNMTVHVSLNRILYYSNVSAAEELEFASEHNITLNGYPNPGLNMTFSGFASLGEITAPANNYHAVSNGGMSLRYVWTVAVQKTEGLTRPPFGYSIVDAATGEIVPFPGHIF